MAIEIKIKRILKKFKANILNNIKYYFGSETFENIIIKLFDLSPLLFFKNMKKDLDSNNKFYKDILKFRFSSDFDNLVHKAQIIDNSIRVPHFSQPGILSPWYDKLYFFARVYFEKFSQTQYKNLILVPFGKMGGADLVAGHLARSLVLSGKTLIISTDLSDWDRPDWYPDDCEIVDLSPIFRAIGNRKNAEHMLYMLIQSIGPEHIYNVNSRLAFDVFVKYGKRLSFNRKMYSYYFCEDKNKHGLDEGYPTIYFENIINYLKSAYFDSDYLRQKLINKFSIPYRIRNKMKVVYTPSDSMGVDEPLILSQIASSPARRRHRILWAGRFDRQKRIDLLIEVASAMPDLDFEAWGKAVLDKPPSFRGIPSNLKIHPPFTEYQELPLSECDGWLYTSQWDGVPTLLIELGARAMPIVASVVGGVSEIINVNTGWPVHEINSVEAYVHALRSMLADNDTRVKKSMALREHILRQHNGQDYRNFVLEDQLQDSV